MAVDLGGRGSGNYGHKGRPGVVGGSAPGGGQSIVYQGAPSVIFTGPSNNIYRDQALISSESSGLDQIMDSRIAQDADLYERVAAALDECGVPEVHFTSIKRFSTFANPGTHEQDTGHSFITMSGKEAVGFYQPLNGTLKLHPTALTGDTLLHEIGHHVHSRFAAHDDVDVVARDAITKLSGKTDAELAHYGLRRYSLTSPAEFLADTYVATVRGSRAQQNALIRLLEIDSYAYLFGSKPREHPLLYLMEDVAKFAEPAYDPRRSIAAIVAAGFTPADAARWLREGAELENITPEAFAMTAVIDEAAIQDARADWYVQVPQEWKLLLDDLGVRDGVGTGERVFYDPAQDVELGGPGSGNRGHKGRPGQVGGSASGGGFAPSRERVWNGQQQTTTSSLTKLEVGARGEALATHVLQERFAATFGTMNTGINNAPVDVAGDHVAVEVKTGLASNGKSAQHWRATIGQPGKAEAALIAQMTPAQKRAHNARKAAMIMQRKQQVLEQMSAVAGGPVKAYTVGVILAPDGKRGDVWLIPGFHPRIGWNQLTDEHYAGTWDVND